MSAPVRLDRPLAAATGFLIAYGLLVLYSAGQTDVPSAAAHVWQRQLAWLALGLVTAAYLLKAWRFAIVIIAVVAAVVTPTSDPINMGLLMAPLMLLYFLSVGMAWIAGRNPTRKPKMK